VKYRRAPRSMASALGRLADEVSPQTLLGDVQRAWGEAVGPLVAEQAQPVSERGGVVTVACAASVWAQELDLMAPQIIARLNELLPPGAVSRLRCVAAGR
jgi:predicted nucleic acid-binding Zn ribbon protein